MTRASTWVRWDDARNLTVVARLAHGLIVGPEWPLPLDGILAGMARRQRMGEVFGTAPDFHLEVLPLATTVGGVGPAVRDVVGRSSVWGAQWVWMASCGRWDVADTDVRYWHARLSDQMMEMGAGSKLPANVYHAHGRYRSYRVPELVQVTGVITWRCIGDRARIAELLTHVHQLGGNRAQGEGRVLEWTVTDEGDPHPDWVWWADDGLIGRPMPARTATHLGVPDCDLTTGSTRPPYWRPPQNTDGTSRREWRPIIAPWTRRPD